MSNEEKVQAKVEVPMITFKVDGQTVSVPKTLPHPVTGKPEPISIIQACAYVGINIPHLCYHPKLPVAGNCRMCLIEYGMPVLDRERKPVLNPDGSPQIRKIPRQAIACATPVAPGMEVYTQTEGVVRSRKAVLEFLALNHPLDCPICDKAGECKLQEYVHQYGQETSLFFETKLEKPKKKAISSKIVLDNERCILCTRCVRFTEDIAKVPALGLLNRGALNTISTYPGTEFEHNYTLNTVDICPVGALTSRDFRFQMRTWFLAETPSICPNCATGCNILIHSRNGHIYRLTPRENDAVNSCWMCDSGRLNYKWVNDSRRLSNVLWSEAGRIIEINWETAISKISAALKSSPKGATAILISARQSTEEIYLVSKLAKLLEAQTDSLARTGEGDFLLLNPDMNPNSKAIQIFGLAAATPGANVSGIAQAIESGAIRNLIAIGENPIEMGMEPGLLSRLDLFVVCDILGNKSTLEAQYLLPGASFAEKKGTFINAKGRVQRFGKAFDPTGEARPEYWILSSLLSALTDRPWPKTPEEIFNMMAAELPAFNGMTWAKLGTAGMNLLSTTNPTEK